MEDVLFYLISFRELVVYPIFFIFISIVLIKKKVDFNYMIYLSAFICLFLLLLFNLLYPQNSYGLTGRFKGFFPREHLPSLFASLAFIYSLYYTRNRAIKIIIILASLYIMMITGSRSVLLFTLFVYIIFELKLSMKSIVFLIMFLGLFYFLSQIFFTRDLYYNIKGRTDQYDLALASIKENFISGIGIDKYGVLGLLEKEYSFRGMTTVTMDSSFIKMFVNIGVPLSLTYLFYLIKNIFKKKYLSYTNNQEILLKRVLILIFLMGLFTGKFGAYPLNMIFFMNILPNKSYIK